MTIFNAELKTDFDPLNDNIAVVVKQFTLRKGADGIQRYSEPYIISMAIDEGGANNPRIEFNILPFPNVRKGDTIDFDGQGHLIYGPNNPGEFLAYSVLFMESDKDVRELGKMVEEVIKSEAARIGADALLRAFPKYSTAVNILLQLTELVSKAMQKNKDDELYRRNGTLLQGVRPPYDVLRTYVGRNDFIESHISIIPLISDNNLGKHTTGINIDNHITPV